MVTKLYSLDLSLLLYLISKRRQLLTHVMVALTRLGDGPFWGLLAAILLLAHSNGTLIVLQLLLAFTLELSIYAITKRRVRRLRPFDFLPLVSSLVLPPDQYSFPSGHTAAAFVVLIIVGSHIGFLLPLLIPLAVGIGISRVYLGVHYPSDVIAGALLGIVCGLIALKILG